MAFHMVDAHNIIPVWEVSEKVEFAARTIRPKIYKKIAEYLTDFPKLEKNENNNTHFVSETFKNTDWDYIHKTLKIHMKIQSYANATEDKKKTDTTNNSYDAHKKLKNFLENKLEAYDVKRNDANVDGQSGLSAHIMWGHISVQRIALETLKHIQLPIEKVLSEDKNGSGDKVFINKNASAFLEELIVRGSLSENFCYYNSNYDNFLGLANWAQEALRKASTDKREYVYTLEEFENALTHDELWNAAQLEMLHTGRMHGYMRMYWAKKILEWTDSPEQAIKYAVYLNDKYELDGWSPNGYAGVLWSIGGLHDRAWFSRPVYGTIRYMARSGCEKKFDVKEYVKKYINNGLF
jgi:deoxyribodipyrimidine photo-lyase